MSSLDSEREKNQLPGPMGKMSFFILPVPNVSQRTVEHAIAFIRGNCYFKQKGESKRYKPYANSFPVEGKQEVSKLILLE